jgi:addiction module RelE/StbE family toxin
MKVEFLKSFSKDLDDVNSKQLKSSLLKVIDLMESASILTEIANTKKLKGHKSAYRVRIGDYRLGFFFEDSVILIARFVHRKDIYKIFP